LNKDESSKEKLDTQSHAWLSALFTPFSLLLTTRNFSGHAWNKQTIKQTTVLVKGGAVVQRTSGSTIRRPRSRGDARNGSGKDDEDDGGKNKNKNNIESMNRQYASL